MIRTRATFAAASVLALSVALTGCGGDDKLTAKEFRTQADKLCKKASTDSEKYGADITAESTEKEVLAAVDKLVDRNEKLADDLADLAAPSDMESDLKAMVKALRAGLKKIDDASLEELGAISNVSEDADAKAKDLGLKECGSSS